jgi:hypothetical protein
MDGPPGRRRAGGAHARGRRVYTRAVCRSDYHFLAPDLQGFSIQNHERAAQQRCPRTGDCVVREGEAGDAMYILQDGACAATLLGPPPAMREATIRLDLSGSVILEPLGIFSQNIFFGAR